MRASGIVQVRDVISDRILTRFSIDSATRVPYLGAPPMAFSPDAKFLVIGQSDGSVEIRESIGGRLARVIPYPELAMRDLLCSEPPPPIHGVAIPSLVNGVAPPIPVDGVALSPGDTLLAVTFANHIYMIVNVRSDTVLKHSVISDRDLVREIRPAIVTFSADSRVLGVASPGPSMAGFLSFVGVPSGTSLEEMPAGGLQYRDVALSPRGDFFALADSEGVFDVVFEDRDLWLQMTPFVSGTEKPVEAISVAFNSDGTSVAGVDNEGGVVVWETVTGAELFRTSLPATTGRATMHAGASGDDSTTLRLTTPIGVYSYKVPPARPLAEQWTIHRAAAAETLATRPVPVSGRVVDSRTGRPVFGSTGPEGLALRVNGATIDSLGRFDLGAARPGSLAIGTRCPSHALLGAIALDTTIAVTPGKPVVLELRIDLARCHEPSFGSRMMRLRGLYTGGFEESGFVPCRDTTAAFREIWGNPLGADVWVGSVKDSRRPWPPPDPSRSNSSESTRYVDWRGTLVGPRRYGHMGIASYELDVSTVYAVRTRPPSDCRVPTDARLPRPLGSRRH